MAWDFVFPFSAIVGQEKVKLALLLNAVNPRLSGVLLKGQKGTAKSSIARSLSRLLPPINVVDGCRFNCDPSAKDLCPECEERLASEGALPAVLRPANFVDFPVSATEDRVVGSLDLQAAIKQGRRYFEPGILAKAHRGVLYIDEVNLLDDHLVDIILDAAASGENVVEREGVSFRHAAQFVLIGSMNPEEGDLRPQLVDRFGLCVNVENLSDPDWRVEVMRRREAFDSDPMSFCRDWETAEAAIRERILNARRLLPRVNMPAPLRRLATDLCLQANVAGLRGDILLQSTARTIAAWAGRAEVQADDVYLAAEFVLVHRAGMTPPPPPPAEAEAPQDEPDKPYSDDPKAQSEQWSNRRTLPPTSQNHVQDDGQKRQEPVGDPDSSPQTETPSETPASSPINAKDGRQSTFEVGTPFPVQRIYARKDRVYRKGSGRRSRTRTSNKQGRYVRATMERKNHDLALDATIRAAAPYQKAREKKGLAISIQESDLREKVREKRVGNLLVFVVDASGSMGAERRMVETKGAILSLLLDAYQKRDRVGLVAFRGKEAKVLLPPTNSVELAQKLLKDLPTGGRTPLAAGLIKGYDVISQYLKKDCDITPILILISDGNANVSCGEGPPLQEVMKIAQRLGEDSRVNYLVIDVEKKGLLSFGLSREIAARLGALYFSLEDLRAENLVASVQLGRSVFHDISAYGGMNN